MIPSTLGGQVYGISPCTLSQIPALKAILNQSLLANLINFGRSTTTNTDDDTNVVRTLRRAYRDCLSFDEQFLADRLHRQYENARRCPTHLLKRSANPLGTMRRWCARLSQQDQEVQRENDQLRRAWQRKH